MVQLKTLYQFAVGALQGWLDGVCLQLEKNPSDYDCVIKKIKELLHLLPPVIFEELARKDPRFYSLNYLGPSAVKVCHLRHGDRKWTLILHPDLGPLYPLSENGSYWQSSKFWSAVLRSLSNLKWLRLSINVDDEILNAIGQGCSENLEILEAHVFSKVTDEGIRCLENCKKLKVIKPNYWKPLKTASLTALANLLLGCPELEILKCVPMADLLRHIFSKAGPIKPLKLIYFEEKENVESVNFQIVEKLCPHLKQIKLVDRSPSENLYLWRNIFKDLTDGKLDLEVIQLGPFNCFDRFDKFLQEKGSRIKSISSCPLPAFYQQYVNVIGENCPHLIHLEFKLPLSALPMGILKPPGQAWFNELRSVCLMGPSEWVSELLLNVLLPAGNKVEHLKVCHHSMHQNYDEVIVKLLDSNRLKGVTKFCASVSSTTLRRLLCELPHLTAVFLSRKGVQPFLKDLIRLIKEFKPCDISIFVCFD